MPIFPEMSVAVEVNFTFIDISAKLANGAGSDVAKKLQSLSKDVDNKEGQYQKTVGVLNATQDSYYTENMPRLLEGWAFFSFWV